LVKITRKHQTLYMMKWALTHWKCPPREKFFEKCCK